MTYEEISKYHRAKPFVPFQVHLKDGRVFTIDDPVHAGWNRERNVFNFSDYGAHFVRLPLSSISHLAPQEQREIA